jgi:hypothetical protein
VREGPPAEFDDEWVRVVEVFPRRDGKLGWGGTGEFFVTVWVDCGYDIAR